MKKKGQSLGVEELFAADAEADLPARMGVRRLRAHDRQAQRCQGRLVEPAGRTEIPDTECDMIQQHGQFTGHVRSPAAAVNDTGGIRDADWTARASRARFAA